jgi:hypothetical protein
MVHFEQRRQPQRIRASPMKSVFSSFSPLSSDKKPQIFFKNKNF